MTTQLKVLKNSKQVWAAAPLRWRGFTLSLLMSSAILFTSNAYAADTYTYKVYAGGIDAVRAYLTIDDTAANKADIKLDAHTRGFLAKLAPWKGTFSSTANKIGNTLNPYLHKSVGIWRDETETKEYRYNEEGQFQELVVTEHNKTPEIKTVSAELTKDTTDILSATLDMLKNYGENGGLCDSTSSIFDGKRRFKMMFKDQENVMLEANKYNSYSGPATTCTVEIAPDGGEWHKKPRGWLSIQEQGRAKGTMPTIWVAQLEGKDYAIPVKIRVKTDYGALFMHLSEN